MADAAVGRRRPRWTLASVSMGAPLAPVVLVTGIQAAEGLQAAAFGVLVPEIRDWFGVSPTLAVTLGTVAGILNIFVALPLGYYADRVNRVRLVGVAGMLWGAMCFLTGIAPTLAVLGVSLMGAAFAGGVYPAHASLVADSYPPESRIGVFSALASADNISRLLGPFAAGYLATAFTWHAPFLVFCVPAVVLSVWLMVKVKEPARGAPERASLGLAGDADHGDQPPPSFTASWRICKSVRSLRRFWWSLPFTYGALIGLASIFSLYYDQVFHLSTRARGDLITGANAATIAGLVVGASVGNRYLSALRPARLIAYTGLMAVITPVMLVGVAVAPTWWLSLVPLYLAGFAGAIFQPALFSLLTLVTPPRVRGLSIGFGSMVAVPGQGVAILATVIGTTVGWRWAMASLAPFFIIGAVIATTASLTVDADMRQARAAAAAATASLAVGEEAARKLLVVRDLDVHLAGVQILFGVDFDIEQGEILALLGTNGAGKSTLLRAVAGTLLPSNGAIFFDREDITHLPAQAHTDLGITFVQGGRGVFGTLTVRENLRLAQWGAGAGEGDVAAAIAYFPVLAERADQLAGNLSGGEQQMLALAQAFITKPKLLMIDELSLGLAPAVVEELLAVVRAIHAAGTTVVLVEQSINVAFTIAQRAVFMEKGEVRFSGPTGQLLDRPDILRAVFLGGPQPSGSYGTRGRTVGDQSRPVVLEGRGLGKAYGGIAAVDGVSLAVEHGSIVGLIGPNGAGKTTLFDLISGFVLPDRGSVLLDGEDVTWLSPDQRARLGLHRSFQDARLFPSLTVVEAIEVSLEKHLEVKSPVLAALHLPNVARAERRLTRRADRLIELFGLGPYRDKFLRELSTGTRRLVDLASVVATEPRVLLLDEPSAGVAQKETEELGPLLERIRFEVGCAIVIIEHDMPLISAVSDELVALDQGSVIARGAPSVVLNHPQVVASYLGTSEAAIARSGAGPTP